MSQARLIGAQRNVKVNEEMILLNIDKKLYFNKKCMLLRCTCRVALQLLPSASTLISPASFWVTEATVSEWLPPPRSILYLGPAVTGTLLWNHLTLASAGLTAHLKMASFPSIAATLFSLVVSLTSLGAERSAWHQMKQTDMKDKVSTLKLWMFVLDLTINYLLRRL